jgi:outer membrane receptor protein involved in Fe transport
VTLRGSYSTSFRAPTFSDLYTLPSEDFPELRNPVRDELSRTDPNFDTDIYPVFEQIRTFRSGNPDLDPEEAQNWTAGIVWTPHFAKRLTISGDWFSIYQENVPGSVDQFILDQNFLGADPTLPVAQRPTDPNAPFANLIQYDPNTLAYNVLYSPTFNLSRRIVEGFDIGIRYTLPTDAAGTWTFGGDLTYYYKFQQANLPGDPLVDRLGDFIDPTQGFGLGSLPRIKSSMSVFWNFHDLELGAIAYYVGSYKDDEAAGFYRHVQDIWTFDLQASYTLPYDFKITVGVQNVADKEPPLVQGAFADNYDRDTHSLLGRFVYGQLTKKF